MTEKSRWLLLGAALALSGCAPALEWSWKPPPDLQALAARYPDAAAVILDREVRIREVVEPRQRVFHQVSRHERRLILTEGGFRYASVRVQVDGASSRIVEVHARTISADGQVHDVDAQRILSDESHGGAKEARAVSQFRVLRFPEVKVGSILELSYTTDTDGPLESWSERVSDPLPVAHFHFEVLVSPSVRCLFRAYNVDARFEKTDLGTEKRVSLDLRDIAARPDEERLPPWQLNQSWVAYTLHSVVWGRTTQFSSDWPHAMRGLAKQLYLEPKKTLDGATVTLPGGCNGPRCWAERALDYAREHTVLSHFKSPSAPFRSLKEVLASGRASNVERAVLVQYALTHAGVLARLAGVSRSLAGSLDSSFPMPSLLDHLVVFLPAQPGLDQPLWLDPSCEWCAAGQIAPWLRDAVGVPFFATAFLEEQKTEAALVPIAGSETGPNLIRRTHDLQLDPAGDLQDTLTLEPHGSWATDWQIETQDRTAEAWRSWAEAIATREHRGGRVLADESNSCDRKKGECQRRVRLSLPGYVSADSDRLLVPLSLVGWPGWDNLFEPEQRKEPFWFGRAELRVEEVVQLHLPEGYSLDRAIEPVQISTPAVDMTLEASVSGDHLTVRRTLTTHPGIFTVDDYPEARRALRAFTEVRSRVLVLRKGPTRSK